MHGWFVCLTLCKLHRLLMIAPIGFSKLPKSAPPKSHHTITGTTFPAASIRSIPLSTLRNICYGTVAFFSLIRNRLPLGFCHPPSFPPSQRSVVTKVTLCVSSVHCTQVSISSGPGFHPPPLPLARSTTSALSEEVLYCPVRHCT